MAGSIQEILSVKVTSRTVRQVAATATDMLQLFGVQPGGGSENKRNFGRQAGYDIFDDTRTVGYGTAPGNPAATITRQAVGRVDGAIPRMMEKLHLPSEELHNYRRIGGPSDTRDEAGRDFVQRQQRIMGQRAANFRLIQLAGMMRGATLYGHESGDKIYYNFTSSGARFSMDWQMPSGNKNQLDMLGAGAIIGASWATGSTNIPHDLLQIDQALTQMTGQRLELIVCNYTVWSYVIGNDEVQALAGTAASPFETFERQVGMASNGLPKTVMVGTIKAVPWVRFIITNESLDLGLQGSTTNTSLIQDDCFWFGPNPSPELFEVILGSEPVSEGYGKEAVVRQGLHSWTKMVDDPTGYMLYTIDNCLMANYVPKASGYADTTP